MQHQKLQTVKIASPDGYRDEEQLHCWIQRHTQEGLCDTGMLVFVFKFLLYYPLLILLVNLLAALLGYDGFLCRRIELTLV